MDRVLIYYDWGVANESILLNGRNKRGNNFVQCRDVDWSDKKIRSVDLLVTYIACHIATLRVATFPLFSLMLVVPQIPLNDGGSNSSVFLSCRGRSRQVSSTALARQASEERRACAAPSVAVHRGLLANSTERTFSQTQKSISCQDFSSSSLSNKVQDYVEFASFPNFIFLIAGARHDFYGYSNSCQYAFAYVLYVTIAD